MRQRDGLRKASTAGFLGLLAAATSAYADPAALLTLDFLGGTAGTTPTASLVQGRDGNFYGTTSGVYGTVFKVTASGALTTLYSFSGADRANGIGPSAALVQGTDGNFYGTTTDGGVNDAGTVFKITPAGVLTTLYSFVAANCDVLYDNVPGLVQGSDGNFYGTTTGGGANCAGTVFKVTPGGVLTTLHSFAGSDGAVPYAGLVQGSSGSFYGTTSAGGANNAGTVFAITAAGALTTLHSFSGTDGAQSTANLVQGSDGNFYGTTTDGGANNEGSVFKITPAGVLTSLYGFSGGSADGAMPNALVQASDGNFYGTTYGGGGPSAQPLYGMNSGSGTQSVGTAFEITPSGVLTTLYSFSIADGWDPAAGLVQGTDGNFYGTTSAGGPNGGGTIFKLSTGLATGAAVVPPAPANLTATAGNGAVTLNWTAAPGATSYNVYDASAGSYQSLSGGLGMQPVATGVTGTALTVTGLRSGTTYYFKVAWVNGSGTSGLSNLASATTLGGMTGGGGGGNGGGFYDYGHGGGGSLSPWLLTLLGAATLIRLGVPGRRSSCRS